MKNNQIIREIRRVLNVQGKSILATQKNIDQHFSKAVELIFKCRGKVVVTGIGKSGLVAQKIASTFSSTGTPAIYLHPVEGMHGNVGIVNKSDVVLALGKSGESEELLNILPTIKKIGAKIISITANKKSSLAKHSTITLAIPIDREACPLNLAPTTSSTLAMVTGDAIAIALMKKRGFSSDQFAFYHPGGHLGRRLLLKVSDVMRSGKDNPVVKITDSTNKLIVEIARKWTGAASVVNNNKKLIGIVTDFDIRKAFGQGKKIEDLKIPDLMNKKPTFIYSDTLVIRALEVMESRKKPLTVLPVVDKKRNCVGMLHLHDLVSQGLVPSGPLK